MIIILDWDGTLVDSAGQIVATMQAAAKLCGLPTPGAAEVRHIIGLGLPEAIVSLYPEIDLARREQLRASYSQCYRDSGLAPAPFFPGVLDTLQALLARGYLLAVATGKSRRGLDRELQLRQLDALFHVTRCADETTSKPHPQMLQEILQYAGKSSDQAVMVGDTVFDMTMADRAGVSKVAVSYGAHPVAALSATAPDLLVDEFSTILEWVLEQPRQAGRV
jgi:phosphoglycolate phosphatase